MPNLLLPVSYPLSILLLILSSRSPFLSFPLFSSVAHVVLYFFMCASGFLSWIPASAGTTKLRMYVCYVILLFLFSPPVVPAEAGIQPLQTHTIITLSIHKHNNITSLHIHIPHLTFPLSPPVVPAEAGIQPLQTNT